MSKLFSKRESIEQVEEGTSLAPKFNDQGLLPVITADAESGEVLMLGYVNNEALERTILTKEMHYYSRSRQIVWHKGETSGLVQDVVELLIDDDQDSLWAKVKVRGSGASCHVGYRSCFYRAIDTENPGILTFTEKEKVFDPEKVYPGMENPTKL